MKKLNFTLRDALIVVFLIGLTASIATPYINRKRINANEGRAIANLSIIATAQMHTENNNFIAADQDEDGSGEYGTLGELAGAAFGRNSFSEKKRIVKGYGPLFKTFAPKREKKIVTLSGYHYQVFLPGPKPGPPITDNGVYGHKGLEKKHQKVIDAQEKHYRLYAWPVSTGTTGIRAFALDQEYRSQEFPVLGTANTPHPKSELQKSYSGEANTPKYNAAVDKTTVDDVDTFTGVFKNGAIGMDGQTWAKVKH